MSLTCTKKNQIEFSKKEELILDGQSKICNWLYNQLLDACQKDYYENNNSLKLLEGRNLRNYGVSLKKSHPFLNSVFSSVLKEPSTRLLKAYKSFFKGDTRYPGTICSIQKETNYREESRLHVSDYTKLVDKYYSDYTGNEEKQKRLVIMDPRN